MNFDLRFPIGMLFSFYGVILVLFGLTSDPSNYARSLGININLDWGVVMLVFGLFMFIMAWRFQKKPVTSAGFRF